MKLKSGHLELCFRVYPKQVKGQVIYFCIFEKALSTRNIHMGLVARKPVFGGFANKTGVGQPVNPRSLISAFVIRFLESIISRLA